MGPRMFWGGMTAWAEVPSGALLHGLTVCMSLWVGTEAVRVQSHRLRYSGEMGEPLCVPVHAGVLESSLAAARTPLCMGNKCFSLQS